MHGDEASTWYGETGLPDRAGWVAVLQVEEQRARRHGGVHGVLLVRLEEPASPQLSARAAAAIAGVIRDIDFLAQLDHQTFAVLAILCEDVRPLVGRLQAALADAGVAATTRIDARSAGSDLRATWVAMTTALPAGPARRHVDFVAPAPRSLN